MTVSGHRISTTTGVEAALVSHPTVAEAVLVGATDLTTGQGIVAVVLLGVLGDHLDPWTSIWADAEQPDRQQASDVISKSARAARLRVVQPLDDTREQAPHDERRNSGTVRDEWTMGSLVDGSSELLHQGLSQLPDRILSGGLGADEQRPVGCDVLEQHLVRKSGRRRTGIWVPTRATAVLIHAEFVQYSRDGRRSQSLYRAEVRIERRSADPSPPNDRSDCHRCSTCKLPLELGQQRDPCPLCAWILQVT